MHTSCYHDLFYPNASPATFALKLCTLLRCSYSSVPEHRSCDLAPHLNPPYPADQTTICGSDCVNTQTDPLHCGSCTNACAPGQTCSSGACTGTATVYCSGNGEAAGLKAQQQGLPAGRA